MGVSGQRHIPIDLYGRLGGSKGRCERVWKISPPLGFDPRTVQTVASCFTDYGIPAHSKNLGLISKL